MSERKIWKLECHRCEHTLGLPTRFIVAVCPHCGAELRIDWHALAREAQR